MGLSLRGHDATAQTDDAGRFLLSGDVPAGRQVLVVEGESASGGRFGAYETNVVLAAHRTTTLSYTIWLTQLDPAGNRRIQSPTTHETRLTTPKIPGLEVRLPAGTRITDAAGHAVNDLNLTPIPVDRPPFPLPAFVSVPLYFTVQPGRAYLSKGAQIIYPNWAHLAPGQRVDFWNYDAGGRGWYVYGHGSVTANGKQVVPDPQVRIWEFTGAMISGSPAPPGTGPPPSGGAASGDPVDLHTGLFTYKKVDLTLPDDIPVSIERTYRQSDANSYSFGTGMTSRYDMRLWSGNNYHEADLILPDGGRVHFVRTSAGEGFLEAEYRSTSSPGEYYGATLKWNVNETGWDMTLENGLTYVFGELAPLQAIRDRYGNTLSLTREKGQTGNITQITSPHGRWATFTYDGANRVTEIKDNAGQVLKYAYKSGLLEKVTDAASRVTSYEYNGSGELTGVTDARGKTYVITEYDSNERVSKQTEADGGIYKFAYALSGGAVESATVTDPREIKRKVTFNAEGFPTSDIHGFETSNQETTTYEPQAGTGLPLSVTDPHGRQTTYKYDSSGNITQRTVLAGTSSARTSEYTYEPGTTELATESDPLKHTTTYHYGPDGELVTKVDALGHETSYEYDGEGELVGITNALGKKTTHTYEFGDLTAVTDPLGRRTSAFIDSLGRLGSSTTPDGSRTVYEYNADGDLTKLTDPVGAVTTYEYDGDGDLTSTTDPNKHTSTASYDGLDRRVTETDALEHTATAVFDKDGEPTEFTDRNGKVSKYTYDSLNRFTEAKYGVSGESAESTLTASYDTANRLTKVVDSVGGTYTPEWDEYNQLTAMVAPAGTVSYEHDAAGRRTSMTVPGQEAVKYKYDDANRLTEVKRGSQAVTFTYDEADRLTKTKLVDGVEEKAGYDVANELTSMIYKKGATTLGELSYSYNPRGGREAVWGSYARMALPEAVSSASYNAANEQTERNSTKLSYDANGNLTSEGSSEFKWNARDQLSTISGGASASFSYDPFGRRSSRTLSGTTTKVLFDGPNAVQEVRGSTTANLLTGLALDRTLARTTSAGTESFLTDALGSTVALADGTGKAETSYTYDPFGKSTQEGAASENPFQYAGRENDGNGLYYNRARYYKPAAARFVSQDPLGQTRGASNLYEYAANRPTNLVDPLGKTFQPAETLPVGEAQGIKEIENEENGLPPGAGAPPAPVNLTAPEGSGGWVHVACEAVGGALTVYKTIKIAETTARDVAGEVGLHVGEGAVCKPEGGGKKGAGLSGSTSQEP